MKAPLFKQKREKDMRPEPFILLISVLTLPAAHAAEVETFVSPDSSFSALSGFIESASESLRIASYTFSSAEIVDLLTEKKQLRISMTLLI